MRAYRNRSPPGSGRCSSGTVGLAWHHLSLFVVETFAGSRVRVARSPRLAQFVALANGASGVAEIIELADVDAVVPQDVVGGHEEKVEMRPHPVPHGLGALHF